MSVVRHRDAMILLTPEGAKLENKGEPTPIIPKLPIGLKTEIENFALSSLHPLSDRFPVSFVSTSVNPVCTTTNPIVLKIAPRCHGFVAIGKPGTKKSPGSGLVYTPARLRLQESFYISPSLIKTHAMKSTKLSAETKSCILLLEGKSFLTGELFLRKLFTLKAEREGLDLKDLRVKENILVSACDMNNKEVRYLLWLFTKSNIKIAIASSSYSRNLLDQKVFDYSLGITVKPYPGIHPLDVREVVTRQQIAIRYLTEKAGQGVSTSVEDKMLFYDRSPSAQSAPLVFNFETLPNKHNFFVTNCNKTARNILQDAENLSAARQHRKAAVVTGATPVAFGDSQAMYLWDPLKPSIKQTILKLIEGRPLSELDVTMKYLMEKKSSIFTFISSLPLMQQSSALHQVLDSSTLLGQVFKVKRTWFWFCRPSRDKFLLKARAQLVEIENHMKEDLIRHKKV